MAQVELMIGQTVVKAEFNDTATAKAILDALPIESTGNYWGSEFYFPIPVKLGPTPEDVEVVEPGTVAYWPAGSCLCVFWGPTPASQGEECRAASPVTVVGRVLDPGVLTRLKGRKVRVQKAGSEG
jgi:hypothetical protein